MKIRFSVDRVDRDSDIAVCFDDNQNKYIFPFSRVELEPGFLFLAELDDKNLPVRIEPLPEETAKRRAELHARTAALFRRSPKQ